MGTKHKIQNIKQKTTVGNTLLLSFPSFTFSFGQLPTEVERKKDAICGSSSGLWNPFSCVVKIWISTFTTSVSVLCLRLFLRLFLFRLSY
jgi:hypothetical protein